MTANLDEEGARYELIEVENERLRKELQSVKMERDACEKTLQVLFLDMNISILLKIFVDNYRRA